MNGTNFTTYGGFCVKVFEAAIQTLNYSFQYIPVGNGITEPNYDDDLIRQIVLRVYCIYITDDVPQLLVIAAPKPISITHTNKSFM